MKLAELNAQLIELNEQLNKLVAREKAEYMGEVAPLSQMTNGNVNFNLDEVQRALRIMEFNEDKLTLMREVMENEHAYVTFLSGVFEQNKGITEVDYNAIPVVSALSLYKGMLENAIEILDTNEQDFELAYHSIMLNNRADEAALVKSLKSIFYSYNGVQNLFDDYNWMFKQAEEVIKVNNLSVSEPGGDN